MINHPSTYTVFKGSQRVASGTLSEVAHVYRAAQASTSREAVLIFDDGTGRSIDFDLRLTPAQLQALEAAPKPAPGSSEDELNGHMPGKVKSASIEQIVTNNSAAPDETGRRVEGAERLNEPAGQEMGAKPESARRRGRPRLGVISREVTLLPRHWEWLATQPGGASVALRKLVESARISLADRDARRQAQERAYQFMLAMGGDLPGYEEASRALFAGNSEALEKHLAAWPADVREHALKLAAIS